MEVVLKGVPVSLTENGLTKELSPFMNVLGIADWTVDKPNRKNIAWVTFLRQVDGERFLQSHGKKVAAAAKNQGQLASLSGGPPLCFRARDQARLYFLSTPIYAERGRRDVKPLTLSHLQYEHDQRRARDQRQNDADKGHRAEAIWCAIRQVSCGKLVFAPPKMALKYIEQSQLSPSSSAKFGRRCLTVTLGQVDRMDVPYDTIEDLITDHGAQQLTLVLAEPPRFYSRAASSTEEAVKWNRLTCLPSWPVHEKYVAHCLIYQLTPAGEGRQLIGALKAHGVLPVSRQEIPCTSSPEPFDEDYSSAMSKFEGRIRAVGSARKSPTPFPILFGVQALVWNNYLHPASGLLALELIEYEVRLCASKGQKLPFTTDAMKRLLQRIPYPVPGVDAADVDPTLLIKSVMTAELDLRRQDASRSGLYGPQLPQHQTWVFKAMVTPTRILLLGPDAESKNRVLRMFPDHGDRFLRVSFCDESGQDLVFNPKVINDAIFERYRKILKEGINIAGRHFSFLGFSHSSLRSHSTWFLCPFIDGDMKRQDRDSILDALGDFSEIRIPAKCAARIGQAFSETPYTVDLVKTDTRVRYIPDVKSADGKRVFSDGVGTLSMGAMEEFWRALPVRSGGSTCFQIRLAGVKGMLSLDSTLPGKVINVRKESMMKFPSTDWRVLGICDTASRPLRLFLNRQMIKILEDMGTDPDAFLTLQEEALDYLKDVTASAVNTSNFLKHQDIGSALKLPSFIKQLDQWSIDYRRDPFLKSVVEHVVLRDLRLLKYKARIPVDKGMTLFGIMDETGFLEEGEVFVTYDRVNMKNGATMDATLTDGPIIVTRSPALHPGDIQCVNMVSPPPSHPLCDLRNCIVFSRKGSRDLPSQLSGGDLDGDLYNIIWDEWLLPDLAFKPADYPRVDPPTLDRAVTPNDIADFFINFMKSDILGLIATRHQILADVRERGTSDVDCITLAGMHSTAVDFSKTGVAVNHLDMPKAPRSRPDFLAPAPPLEVLELGQINGIADPKILADDADEDGMGMMKPRYHRSQKILGHLYRDIDERKIWDEHIHRKIAMRGPTVWEQVKGLAGRDMSMYGIEAQYHRYSSDARKIRSLYEDSISDSMWQYSENPRRSITEAEAFCGSVLNKRGTQTRQQRDASIQLKEATDRNMTWICKVIRNSDGESPASGSDVSSDSDSWEDESYRAIRRAWACLVVGCQDSSEWDATDRGTGELQSFKVVAAACLLRELALLRTKSPAGL